MKRFGIAAAAAALVAALVPAPPAGADWLITRDGARVETAGPWQVKGKLVVFADPRGVLASLRLAEVDLEASAAATAAAKESTKEKAPAAPAAPRRAVWVLTDADVAPAADAGGGTAETAGGGADGASATESVAGASANGFSVTSWDRTTDPDSGEAAVTGQLRNDGERSAPAPPLQVSVFDEIGKELATAPAVFESPDIPPEQAVSFRAVFPGVGTFAAARFAIGGAGAGPSKPAAVTPDTPEPPPGPAPSPGAAGSGR